MGTGSVQIASGIGLREEKLQVADLEAFYAELEEEESWERKSLGDRVLSVATIALISACGWTAIIALVQLLR
jgi:hypothetical protein